MRRGLGLIAAALAALTVMSTTVSAQVVEVPQDEPTVSSQVADGPRDEQGGADARMWADGGGATAIAWWLGSASQSRPGGPNVVCWQRLPSDWDHLNGPDNIPALDPGFFSDPPEWVGESGVFMWVSCGTPGAMSPWRPYIWQPTEPPIRPEVLAQVAVEQLPFPLPAAVFAPPLDDPSRFLLVNFPTWIWVQDWSTSSRTATAGGVTTTVTATPIRLEWSWPSVVPDGGASGSCTNGSVAYNRSIPASAQSTPCEITFRRPSTREPDATYQGTVTVVYHVTWESNTGQSGDLGEVPRTTPTAVRVGEQQVLTR